MASPFLLVGTFCVSPPKSDWQTSSLLFYNELFKEELSLHFRQKIVQGARNRSHWQPALRYLYPCLSVCLLDSRKMLKVCGVYYLSSD